MRPKRNNSHRQEGTDFQQIQQYHNRINLEREESFVARCCLPSGAGCQKTNDPITITNPKDAVKVLCDNTQCKSSGWMHVECFTEWQEHILTQLRISGRARSWNEKQRKQNLWTKKGYDLVYKICDCLCGSGHLRKDLDYYPNGISKNGKKHRKNRSPTSLKVNFINTTSNTTSAQNQIKGRERASSISSTGSSPPSSANSPPSSSGMTKFTKFSMFTDNEQAAAGNIFKRRLDLHAFDLVPPQDKNPYHIFMSDDGPHGNDEQRVSVLSCLSSKQVTNLPCSLCGTSLPIYDRYPLVDGTLYLSPMASSANVVYTTKDDIPLYIQAACVACLVGHNKVSCKFCSTAYDGKHLCLGSMYNYDIFAAKPCCDDRFKCKSCSMVIQDPSRLRTMNYSDFSKVYECMFCQKESTHLVKATNKIFNIRRAQPSPICS